MDEVIETVYSTDHNHRVVVLRRADGFFTYQQGFWVPEPDDEEASCWIEGDASGIYDGRDTAWSAARVDVPWLAAEIRAKAEQLAVEENSRLS